MKQVWRSRPDLQKIFPNVDKGEPTAISTSMIHSFLLWWETYHLLESSKQYKETETPTKVNAKTTAFTVLFIWPGIRLVGWNSYHVGRGVEACFINHGLASISANLKKHGYDTFLVDLRKLHSWDEFEKVISNLHFDIICIGFHSVDEPFAFEATKRLKVKYPNVPIIVGGNHLTIVNLREFGSADCVVHGDGEEIVVKLLKDLEKGKSLPKFISASDIYDLNQLPVIDRSLFDQKVESETSFLPLMTKPMYSINLGRGCWFKRCIFCHESGRNLQWRVRSPENCISEIKSLLPIGSLMIHDDIFPPAYWCRSFIKLWYEENVPRIPFWCQMRADFVCQYPDLIQELSEIGLTWVSLGVESASQRMLDFLDKRTTVEQNYKSVEILHENNINIFMNMVFAMPTETKKDIDANVDFVSKTRPAWLSLSPYTCYPGSKLYKYCEKNNLFLNEHYSMIRYPYERKIRGIDYKYVFSKIKELHRMRGDLRTYSPRNIKRENLDDLPLVSVIVLSYNRPKYLLEAVKSLQEQTNGRWEAIIIDGSDIPEIHKALNKIDEEKRVRTYTKKSSKLSLLWNMGIDLAKGKYICILDDDNRKKPEFLQKMSEYLDSNQDKDVVICLWDIINRNGNKVRKAKMDSNILKILSKDDAILKDYYIDNGGMMFRKNVIDKVGWFDERLDTQEDWDYLIRLWYQSKGFGLIPQSLCEYRIHDVNRMKCVIESNAVKDKNLILSKRHINPYRIKLYDEHINKLTSSQKDVIIGIKNALCSIEWVKVVKNDYDLLVIPAPFMVDANRIKDMNRPFLFLNIEDPAAMRTNERLVKLLYPDGIVTNDESTISTYNSLFGDKRTIFWLSLGIDDIALSDLVYRDIEYKQKDIDIIFIGCIYKSRIEIVKKIYSEFKDKKVMFIGDNWDNYVPWSLCKPTLSIYDTMQYLMKSKIIIISERQRYDCGGTDSQLESQTLHRGYFECGSGGAVVIYTKQQKNYRFSNEVKIVYTVDDLLKTVKYLLNNPNEAKEMGKIAKNKSLKHFTYKNRLTKILNAFRSPRYGYKVW